MKKTLAIVLALVLVLAMVPVSFAAKTTVTDIDEALTIVVKDANLKTVKSVSDASKISFDYDGDFAKIRPDDFEAEAAYALIVVEGFKNADEDAVAKVNGKEISEKVLGKIQAGIKSYDPTTGKVFFAVELPKGGLTAAYAITVESETENASKVERMTITVAGKDTTTAGKTELDGAVKVVSDNGTAYLVGNVFYIDYEKKADSLGDELTFTFADNKGAIIKEIAMATIDTLFADEYLDDGEVVRVIKDAANIDGEEYKAVVETKNAIYKSPKFKFSVRTGIKPEDVKGIYFADYSKTIATGETYTPVVLGVANGLPVAAKIELEKGDPTKYIQIIDEKSIFGVYAGTTYIKATYEDPNGKNYESYSMKLTVTGDAYKAPVTKYVACRALNVRKGPGTSYSKVGLVYRGQEMKVLETAGGWSKVEYAGGIAYVCDKYLAK